MKGDAIDLGAARRSRVDDTLPRPLQAAVIFGAIVVLLLALRTGVEAMRRPAMIPEIDDAAFVREVAQAEGPVVVEYWADFCIPCGTLAPHLDKLARKYSDRVKFRRLNMRWSAEVTVRYKVPGVPTLIFYRHGREVSRLQGMPAPATDAALERFVEQGLAAPS